jgi:hypothetical protein
MAVMYIAHSWRSLTKRLERTLKIDVGYITTNNLWLNGEKVLETLRPLVWPLRSHI